MDCDILISGSSLPKVASEKRFFSIDVQTFGRCAAADCSLIRNNFRDRIVDRNHDLDTGRLKEHEQTARMLRSLLQ